MQSKSEEDEEEEEDGGGEEEEEEEEEEVEEEEDDTSASSTEKPAEEIPPEELKEECVPDGEQKAVELCEQTDAAGAEKTEEDEKKSSSVAQDGNSKTPSGSNMKLSLFRRLSSSRLKQTGGRDQTLTGEGISRDGVPEGEPPPPGSPLRPGARGPRSGACSVL